MILAQRQGRVTGAHAGQLLATLPAARVGETATIAGSGGCAATVVRVDGPRVVLLPHGAAGGIGVGDRVVGDVRAGAVPLGMRLLGRAIAPSGEPLDGRGPTRGRTTPIDAAPIEAGRRPAVTRPLWTGVRGIDGLTTVGRGARIGIFGGPGTGKSQLVEQLVRNARADAVVLALIGERGREAATWISHVPPHATVVCAPSDRPAVERLRAAQVALAHADALRSRGLHVFVVLDSLARVAGAAREIAATAGEAVGRGGYPPSVFAEMMRLLERGGNVGAGSITIAATVLTDGDDERDPLAEAARAALDGHILLCPKKARSGLFPALDLTASLSRTMTLVVDAEHAAAARTVRNAIGRLEATRDLRELGFLQADPELERAVALGERLEAFVHAGSRITSAAEMRADLLALAACLRGDSDLTRNA